EQAGAEHDGDRKAGQHDRRCRLHHIAHMANAAERSEEEGFENACRVVLHQRQRHQQNGHDDADHQHGQEEWNEIGNQPAHYIRVPSIYGPRTAGVMSGPFSRTATMRPLENTTIRSLKRSNSSRSALISSTAQPPCATSSMRRCRKAAAETSMPRVGWSAIRNFGLVASSRAAMSFCALPPERESSLSVIAPARTEYCLIMPLTRALMAFQRRKGPRNICLSAVIDPAPAMAFSARDRPGAPPCEKRSAGRCASPCLRQLAVSARSMSTPLRLIVPLAASARPESTDTRPRWPLP